MHFHKRSAQTESSKESLKSVQSPLYQSDLWAATQLRAKELTLAHTCTYFTDRVYSKGLLRAVDDRASPYLQVPSSPWGHRTTKEVAPDFTVYPSTSSHFIWFCWELTFPSSWVRGTVLNIYRNKGRGKWFFHVLIYSPGGCDDQVWTRQSQEPTTASKSPVWVSGPKHLGLLLLLSWVISRMLGWKHNSWDSSWLSCGIQTSQAVFNLQSQHLPKETASVPSCACRSYSCLVPGSVVNTNVYNSNSNSYHMRSLQKVMSMICYPKKPTCAF